MELCEGSVTDHRREESKVHDGLGTLQSFSSSGTESSRRQELDPPSSLTHVRTEVLPLGFPRVGAFHPPYLY